MSDTIQNKTALVTGATAGIGWATAIQLAKAGYRIIACGRRKEKLDALSKEIGTEFHSLVFDVSDWDACQKAFSSLPAAWQRIDLLVSNAGNAHGLDEYHESDMTDTHAMVGSNILGVMHLARLVSPQMAERGEGHIINISSIAGKENYPKAAVYCATKAAVESFTKGLRIDLSPYGVKVTGIAPGAVETEFSMVRFKGDEERSETVYQGFEPLTAEDIAESVMQVATAPDRVLYSDVTILPKAQSTAYTIHRK